MPVRKLDIASVQRSLVSEEPWGAPDLDDLVLGSLLSDVPTTLRGFEQPSR